MNRTDSVLWTAITIAYFALMIGGVVLAAILGRMVWELRRA